MPGAVSKAIFDLIWDFFRDKSRTLERSRSRGIETTARANAENEMTKEISNEAGGESAVPSTVLERAERDLEEGNAAVESSESSETRREVSLLQYLGENLYETNARSVIDKFVTTFPTFSATLGRLPYALLPFALSQFILVEALAYTGWIAVFSRWLAIVVGFSLPATIFVVGVVSILLCNCSGTNIGQTILLVKVLNHPNFAGRPGTPPKLMTGGMLALALGSNIGAVSLTFSASLAGTLRSLQRIDCRFAVARDTTTKRDHNYSRTVHQMEHASVALHDGSWLRRFSSRHHCGAELIPKPFS